MARDNAFWGVKQNGCEGGVELTSIEGGKIGSPARAGFRTLRLREETLNLRRHEKDDMTRRFLPDRRYIRDNVHGNIDE